MPSETLTNREKALIAQAEKISNEFWGLFSLLRLYATQQTALGDLKADIVGLLTDYAEYPETIAPIFDRDQAVAAFKDEVVAIITHADVEDIQATLNNKFVELDKEINIYFERVVQPN